MDFAVVSFLPSPVHPEDQPVMLRRLSLFFYPCWVGSKPLRAEWRTGRRRNPIRQVENRRGEVERCAV